MGATFATFVVLLLLTYILLPLFGRGRGTKIDHSIVNLKFLANALSLYAQDNNGLLPPMHNTAGVGKSLSEYTVITESPSGKVSSALIEPLSGDPYQPNPSLSGKQLSRCNPGTVAFYNRHTDKFGRQLAVTLDGQIRYLSEQDTHVEK